MNKRETIAVKLLTAFRAEAFSLSQAYEVFDKSEITRESVRARIYENVGKLFEKVSRGVYTATLDGLNCVLIHGNGRDLSMLEDNSIDCIITDHPWIDVKAHTGGNRTFADYGDELAFKYTEDDFKEKCRVLAPGAFLVEFLPCETESNWKDLWHIKQMAMKHFNYYAMANYYEPNKIRNTGRQSKSGGQLLILTKGKARSLRPDAKKNKANGVESGNFMSGANGMLPVYFEGKTPPKSELIHTSEKSVELITQLLHFLTKEGEVVLDQFGGSNAVSAACHETGRFSIAIEKSYEAFIAGKKRMIEAGATVLAVFGEETQDMTMFTRQIESQMSIWEYLYA